MTLMIECDGVHEERERWEAVRRGGGRRGVQYDCDIIDGVPDLE